MNDAAGKTPYEILGVGRDANEAEIDAAFRRLSKVAHPDAGGTAEAYVSLCRARDVLTDPMRRRRFDATGVDDDRTNDDRAVVISKIVGHIGAAIGVTEGQGVDPSTIDLVEHARRMILKEVEGVNQNVSTWRKRQWLLKRVISRVLRTDGGSNFVVDALNAQAREVVLQVEQAREDRRLLQLTLEELSHFRFDVADDPLGGNFRLAALLGPAVNS